MDTNIDLNNYNKDVDPSIAKAKAYAESRLENQEQVDQDLSKEKIIQITLGEEGLPNIRYQNLNSHEILGILRLSTMITESNLYGNLNFKQQIIKMVESL